MAIRPDRMRLPKLTHSFKMTVVAPTIALIFAACDTYPFVIQEISRYQIAGRDFANYYASAVLVWHHQVATIFDPQSFGAALSAMLGPPPGHMLFAYPPLSLFYFLLLGLLPYAVAFWVWMVATSAMFVRAIWPDFRAQWRTLGLLLISPASVMNLIDGQNGYLSAALICGGLLTLPRSPIFAGILIGLLSFKPQLGLLFPILLLATAQWRAFCSAAATSAILILASIGAFGLDAWISYVGKVAPTISLITAHESGIFVYMMPSFFVAGRVMGFPIWLCFTVQAVSALCAVAATLWSSRQPVPWLLKAAVAMIAILLISPYVFNYDMLAVSVAIVIIERSLILKKGEQYLVELAWISPVMIIPLGAIGLPVGPPILAGLLAMAVLRIRSFSAQPYATPMNPSIA